MYTPDFYDPTQVGVLRHPDVALALATGRSYQLTPFSADHVKRLLLLVDPQVGFIHEGRNLAIPGALDDTRRIIAWIYRNLEQLTNIAATMDSHLPYQIFYSTWWRDAAGNPIAEWSSIKLKDLGKTVFPIFDFNYTYAPGKTMRWSQYYLTQLENFGKATAGNADAFSKKPLTIYPFHCMLGTPEHAIEPSLYEAIMVQAGARISQPIFEVKGTVAMSEGYSALETEVRYDGDPRSGVNETFLAQLEEYERIYIAGQASSHCVLETIYSIIRFFGNRSPEVLSRIRIFTDAMSPVRGFESMAKQAYKELKRNYGLQLITTTDPLD